MSKIEVDTIDKQSGSTLTIGGSGTTVTLASGATQSGFGRSGSVNWETTVKTTSFTAANGEGYFVNTTSGAITVTLPSSPSAGDIVAVQDYAGNIASNNITIGRNSSPINGATSDLTISENNASAVFVYIDGTQGWKVVSTASLADLTEQPSFICASGGTETESGNFKIHTFTGPGTFTVNSLGNTLGGGNKVSYMVVAGGAGGGVGCSGGGGGAGGFREGKTSNACYTASPIVAPDGLEVSLGAFPIVVGGGGSGISPFTSPSFPSPTKGTSGNPSSFSTITSAGGGGGGGNNEQPGINGGSGGGGAHSGGSVGSGNTPPVSPPQGKNGATPAPGSGPAPSDSGGGGGGATGCAVGGPSGRQGGAGATTSINGTPTAYAGGGGGTNRDGGSASDTAGGAGGGGRGGFGPRPSPAPEAAGVNGSTNTGGGGGGGKALTPAPSNRPYGGSGTGGSGIVIIRYKFQ